MILLYSGNKENDVVENLQHANQPRMLITTDLPLPFSKSQVTTLLASIGINLHYFFLSFLDLSLLISLYQKSNIL